MIAVLLAGGKGTRLGKTGRFIPKPLIPIGDQPVINQIVNKLLNFGQDVSTIYILNREIQPLPRLGDDPERQLDLKKWFTSWKEVWYSDEINHDRVKLVFEEWLPDPQIPGSGAIMGLYRFMLWIQGSSPDDNDKRQLLPEPPILKDDDHVLVFAADNFLEDNLGGFLDECKKWPNSVINAYFDFHDKEKVRKKYGTIILDELGWAVGYEEKPIDPALDQTKASAAIYAYPFAQFKELENYVHRDAAPYSLDAPGNLLKWFVLSVYPPERVLTEEKRERGEGVRGYELRGKWFDIGMRADLIEAVVWFAKTVVNTLETVADLKLVQRTDDLNDRYFLLCHQIEIDIYERRICIYCQSSDPICKLSSGVFGRVPSVSEIKKQAKRVAYWSELRKALQGETAFERRVLASPVLLSGGVFLFDSTPSVLQGGHSRLRLDRTLLPLLEKDAGALTDAGRLTTPAGRMDILDLAQVCYAELAEEMIFYGTSRVTEQTTIYCCAPPEQRKTKQRVLHNIIDKRIEIPGLDHARIATQAALENEEQIDIVEIIPPTEIVLPRSWSWSVEIYLDDILQSKCENVVVIPDQDNATIEFRIVCTADMTGFRSRPESDRHGRRVGRLMGIVDGDGYERRSLLVRAADIRNYYNKMRQRDSKEILDYLFQSQHDSVTVLATGEGRTGRFTEFESRMPALTFTTSVRYLMDLLDELM